MPPAPSAVEMQTCVQQHGNIDTSEKKYICEYLTGVFEHVWQAAILVESKRTQFGTGLIGHI